MESLEAAASSAAAPAATVPAEAAAIPDHNDKPIATNAVPLNPEKTGNEAKEAAESEPERKRRKKNLSNDERRAMAEFLLQRCQGTGRLPHSALADVAATFGVHRNTASRIWQLLKPALVKGEPLLPTASSAATPSGAALVSAAPTAAAANVSPPSSGRLSEELAKQVLSRKRNSGRRKKDYSAELARLKELPMHQRGSLRALASAVGVPRTTLFRLLRDKEGGGGDAEADASSTGVHDTVKPLLSDKNKMERLRFCSAKLRPNGLFDDMLNVVHLNMRPFPLCGSIGGDVKGETGKKKARIMFLAAVARPQWDTERNVQFDGKIGVWPFVTTTAVDTPTVVEAVTKAEIQQLLVSRVLPAIREKLPRHQHVLVQLDSQHVRLPPDDPVVSAHGSVDGWSMRLQYQPPYSPDLVVLDNAFFRSIELSVKESRPETLEQLVTAVERAFAAMPKRRVTDAFLVLQKKMEATMRVRGSNTYEMAVRPTKRSLQLDGSVPMSVLCDPEAALECRAALEMIETVL